MNELCPTCGRKQNRRAPIKKMLAEELCKIMGWEGDEWSVWTMQLPIEKMKQVIEKLKTNDPK